jgi:hypothetical protein
MPSKTLYVCPVHLDIVLYEEWNSSKTRRERTIHRNASAARVAYHIRTPYRSFESKISTLDQSSRKRAKKSATKFRKGHAYKVARAMGIPIPKRPRKCPKCDIYYYKWECIERKGHKAI